MTISPHSIFNQTADEKLKTVQCGLHALTALLNGKSVDDFDIFASNHIATLIKTLADIQQSARLEIIAEKTHLKTDCIKCKHILNN